MKFIPDRTICIITQSHLCRNPRVLKEAITLADEGYTICLLYSIISQELFEQDKEAVKNHNIHLYTISDLSTSNYRSIIDRAFARIGRSLTRYLKIESPTALGYGYYKYLKKSRSINASLYICHQEMATYIGTKLIEEGFKVAFDLEDWYSEDLLPEARAGRPVNLLRKAEGTALKNGVFTITTSAALAKKLAEVYACPLPAVVYNVFPSEKRLPDRSKELNSPLKLFWFSQTVGPGRGIEEFINVLNSVSNKLELHLLGNIDVAYKETLTSLMLAVHTIVFHQPVSVRDLPAKIAEFDIGLALENLQPMSRNYTITNKFFQYLEAGLPIIATETAGQNEGFEKFKPGFKLSQNPSGAEIDALNLWLNNPAELKAARQRAADAAQQFNWENEAAKLIQLTHQAFEHKS